MSTESLPEVTCAKSAFAWPHHYTSAPGISGTSKSCAAKFLRKFNFATAFSGVCAPSTGLHMLSYGFSSEASSRMQLEYLFAIECDPHAANELRVLPEPPRVLIDVCIGSFLTAETKRIIAQFGPEPTCPVLLLTVEFAIAHTCLRSPPL